MNSVGSSINFEGRKNPKLHLRRKQVKNLHQKETELTNKCNTLKNDCKALELTYGKVSELAYDHPKAPKVSQLWKLKFDMQYNYLYGSYKDYHKSRIKYAKEAVQNKDILKFVKQPIKFNGSFSIFALPFSKVGRNMLKNSFIDKFRRKTPAEKELLEYSKDTARTNVMHQILGVNK